MSRIHVDGHSDTVRTPVSIWGPGRFRSRSRHPCSSGTDSAIDRRPSSMEGRAPCSLGILRKSNPPRGLQAHFLPPRATSPSPPAWVEWAFCGCAACMVSQSHRSRSRLPSKCPMSRFQVLTEGWTVRSPERPRCRRRERISARALRTLRPHFCVSWLAEGVPGGGGWRDSCVSV